MDDCQCEYVTKLKKKKPPALSNPGLTWQLIKYGKKPALHAGR